MHPSSSWKAAVRGSLLFAALIVGGSPALAAAMDLADEVNVMIGTDIAPAPPELGPGQADRGNVFPGAVRPFGMVNWGADPAPGLVTDYMPYDYANPSTRGFALNHVSGAGCGLFGDVPILPITGAPTVSPAVRSSPYIARYRHEDEHATPGAYAVRLDSGIGVQLAAATRAGIAAFDLPQSASSATLIIDTSRNYRQIFGASVTLDGRTVTGAVKDGSFCQQENRYTVYFALEADADPSASGTFDERGLNPGATHAEGGRTGAYLTFDTTRRHRIGLRVGLSYVSADKARANVNAEAPGWDVDALKAQARAAWNDALSRVTIDGGDAVRRRVFYTALFHALQFPSVFSDADGEYIGFDDKRHKVADGHALYANFSGWDIYRTQVPLLAMLFPHEASDMAASLVADAAEGGAMPKWPVANDESDVMVGDPAAAIIAGFHAFGARDFDTRAALAALLRAATDPGAHARLYLVRPQLAEYLRKGYVTYHPRSEQRDISSSAPLRDGSAAITLEMQAADFALSRLAQALGDEVSAAALLERSHRWRALFDPSVGYIRARGPDDAFLPNFDPTTFEGFVEGNAAQYTLMPAWDVEALTEALGGPARMLDRLDHFFEKPSPWVGGGPTQARFAIENEPSFHQFWLYNWLGKPSRAQALVRQTVTERFLDTPGGLPGNDDLGATSAWLVLAELGLYPIAPGEGGLTLSTPGFPRATLRAGEHTLAIEAPDAGHADYVRNVALDGTPLPRWWVDWPTMSRAKRLTFDLSAAPVDAALGPPPPFR